MNQSGAGPRADRPSPVVLRLLPHVLPPPAKVLVIGVGSGHEAYALDARGYDVTVVDDSEAATPAPASNVGGGVLAAPFVSSDFGARFDLVCEHGALDQLDRAAWAVAASRALRPGGQLFGSVGGNTSALLHALAPYFEVTRCQPGGFGDGRLELVAVRR